MNKETIKELALANGFKLKEQPDGTMDLNPYVFEFAAALERVATAELKAQVEQLQEKIFELQCFDVDVIRCLKTMAFDHNHADILSYQKLAKKCMDRISAENKANEIKAQAVEALKFPTMFRKMWSGGEVQAWIKEEAKLIRQAANGGE